MSTDKPTGKRDKKTADGVYVHRLYIVISYDTIFCFDQYSLGSNRVVELRSASVIIQIFSPALVVYADTIRNPCSTENSFSCLSASGTSPQSPLTCRSRNSAGSC